MSDADAAAQVWRGDSFAGGLHTPRAWRTLWTMLALSLVLHAFALWALRGWRVAEPEAPPVLTVRLHEVQPPIPVQEPPRAPEPVRNAPLKRAAPRPQVERPAEPEPQATPAPLSESPLPPPPVLTAPPGTGSGPPVAALPPAPPREEPDDNLLAGYIQTLSALLARNQTYPRIAQIRRWEGEVQLRVHVAKKGTVSSVAITQSSGYEVLDRRAVEMLKEASPLPGMPDALRGREFSIIVPVLFRLERS